MDRIELKLSSPDFVLYNDFKTRYQNLDLISDFTEFQTRDKLGRMWVSNLIWSSIDTSFNQDYNTDELSNVAWEVPFSVELHYYTVYDEQYYNIQGIIMSLVGEDSKTQTSITIKL